MMQTMEEGRIAGHVPTRVYLLHKAVPPFSPEFSIYNFPAWPWCGLRECRMPIHNFHLIEGENRFQMQNINCRFKDSSIGKVVRRRNSSFHARWFIYLVDSIFFNLGVGNKKGRAPLWNVWKRTWGPSIKYVLCHGGGRGSAKAYTVNKLM